MKSKERDRWEQTQLQRVEEPFSLGVEEGIGNTDLEMVEFQGRIPRYGKFQIGDKFYDET